MKHEQSGSGQRQTRLASDEKQRPQGQLDDELKYRLEATLSEESKLELTNALALAEDEIPEEEEGLERPAVSPVNEADESVTAIEAASTGTSAVPRREEGGRDAGERPGPADEDAEGESGREQEREAGTDSPSREAESIGGGEVAGKEVIARIEFRDGDTLLFEAIPADGEIGVAYEGDNQRRSLAVLSPLASPVRLFASLAPVDVPMPWLLPAIDRPPDRDQLVGDRSLCDRLEEPVRAASEVLRLRIPGTAEEWWTPGGMAIGGYCGWNGQQEFKAVFCDPEWNPGTSGLWYNIFKCTAGLSSSILHTTHDDGRWRRRRRSDALCAACGSPVRILIQYMGLGAWKTASNKIVGPANLTGAAWQGLINRRRRIRYTRWGNVGGVRAFSRFTQKYFKIP